MSKFSYHKTEKGSMKLWDSHGAFEPAAMKQLENVANMPFIHKHIAGMPDVHLGMGATIGSVIATKGVIIPAAVGVDIGCGMMAVRTTLTANDLPDNLNAIRSAIEAAVPHGRTDNGGVNDTGSHLFHTKKKLDSTVEKIIPEYIRETWKMELDARYKSLTGRHPKIAGKNGDAKTIEHLGTLGTGNHFIEVCLDEDDAVWVMLHSGSRGPGNRIGMYFIEKAKEEMRRYHIDKFLPDQDLSYVVEHTEIFNDYVEAVDWAQKFAKINRELMMDNVLAVINNMVKPFSRLREEAVNCHHNYITKENHFGDNVWVTRKGAVQARKGTLGIIPGSMGTGSFIVKGLGNKESFCSCSHGAGRVMSRTRAKKEISMEQHAKAMSGIEARLDADVIDESPAAYKDIGAVMDAQSDLVEIVARLRQVINVKG